MDDRRQVPRYLSELPAQLSHPGSGVVSRVSVLTLSVRGCSIAGVSGLETGKTCQLSIEWLGREVRVDAEVAWQSPQGRAGLKFLSMEQKSSDTLRELLTSLRLQPLIPTPPDE